jgi:hypothetical protein
MFHISTRKLKCLLLGFWPNLLSHHCFISGSSFPNIPAEFGSMQVWSDTRTIGERFSKTCAFEFWQVSRINRLAPCYGILTTLLRVHPEFLQVNYCIFYYNRPRRRFSISFIHCHKFISRFIGSGSGFPSNATLVWIFYSVTATCFGLMTIFRWKYIYIYVYNMYIFPPEVGHKTETCSGYWRKYSIQCCVRRKLWTYIQTRRRPRDTL